MRQHEGGPSRKELRKAMKGFPAGSHYRNRIADAQRQNREGVIIPDDDQNDDGGEVTMFERYG